MDAVPQVTPARSPRRSRPHPSSLPTGPRSPGWFNSARYALDSYGFYDAMRARYGDTFTVQTVDGPLVVTGDPAFVRELFTAPTETFKTWSNETLAPFLGRKSLLLSYGDRHRRDRKLLTPPFHGARMRAYGEMIRAATRTHLEKLPLGRVVAVQPTMQAISLDVIVRAVFGVSEGEQVEAWRSAILTDVRAVTPAIIFVGQLRRELGGVGPWARHVAARAALDTMMFDEMRRRRATVGDASHAQDILGLILSARYDDGSAMADDEVRDQLITLVAAGHETTATSLAWSIEWLARLPAVRDRLTAEVDALGDSPSPEAIAALPYLDAFCTEALRTHPIVPDIARELIAPLRLGIWNLPPGVAVAAATTLLHSNPTLYPDPYSFKPERWLDKKPSPFEYTPFGGGARRCLGSAFAIYEMKIALATIVRALTFEPAHRAPTKPARQNITIGPAGGVEIVARRRVARATG